MCDPICPHPPVMIIFFIRYIYLKSSGNFLLDEASNEIFGLDHEILDTKAPNLVIPMFFEKIFIFYIFIFYCVTINIWPILFSHHLEHIRDIIV